VQAKFEDSRLIIFEAEASYCRASIMRTYLSKWIHHTGQVMLRAEPPLLMYHSINVQATNNVSTIKE
jgi:hypothetical protein